MKWTTLSALFFAASISLAIAVPARKYYYDEDEDEYPATRVTAGRPISLANAPFFYQARTLELDQFADRGRKYKIVRKKKQPGAPPGSEEEEPQDDDASDESSEEDEEEDEENNEESNNEEQSFDVPPWEKLFPEEDKNTGTFQDQPSYDGSGSGLPGVRGGAPAPESSGSLLNLFSGGNLDVKPMNDGGPPSGGQGQGQYRQGPPPPGYNQRGRSSLPVPVEEGKSVFYDGYRYIPVKPVTVRVPKRQSKKVKPKTSAAKVQIPVAEGRSLPTTSTKSRSNKRPANKKQQQQQFVLVPFDRDSREIRFQRDPQGFKVESGGSMYQPTEIWRWEGRGHRPGGLYYAPPRPQRGSASSIRFAKVDHDDY